MAGMRQSDVIGCVQSVTWGRIPVREMNFDRICHGIDESMCIGFGYLKRNTHPVHEGCRIRAGLIPQRP
ncbi:hypothetical protein D3C76_1379170 [compost metagenome]